MNAEILLTWYQIKPIKSKSMASASIVFVPQTLSSAISSKLTEDNFLITWMQLAESTIKGYR